MPTSDLVSERPIGLADSAQWTRSDRRIAAVLVGVELAFVALAAIVGTVLHNRRVPVHAGAPPLAASGLPHVGVGTPIALAVAVAVIWRGFVLARTTRWGWLVLSSYATTVIWTVGLALIDGWHRGIANRLATPDEYTPAAAGVTNIAAMLRTFTQHIVAGPAGAWPDHVAGGPPGGFLLFIGLDRIGLGGGAWAGVVCILLGSLAPVGVAVTVRALAGERAARIALPFLVLSPAAIWVGVSADGAFAGIAATGIALIALPGWRRAALGGLTLGYTLYLSYGLVLLGVLALAVLWLKPGRRLRDLLVATGGAMVVAVAFSAAGFWWPTGYRQVVVRYYQGWGAQRPYSYWVWADLAALVACAGPMLVPVLRHVFAGVPSAVRTVRTPRPVPAGAVLTWLPLAALIAIVCADVSGLSKGEVERIWLPFTVWLVAAAPLLHSGGTGDRDGRLRLWLTLQAVTALAINSLLLTNW